MPDSEQVQARAIVGTDSRLVKYTMCAIGHLKMQEENLRFVDDQTACERPMAARNILEKPAPPSHEGQRASSQSTCAEQCWTKPEQRKAHHFMGSMQDLRGGPSEQQVQHALEQRRLLQQDLAEQVASVSQPHQCFLHKAPALQDSVALYSTP